MIKMTKLAILGMIVFSFLGANSPKKAEKMISLHKEIAPLSSYGFLASPKGTLTLTSPNGGEQWVINNTPNNLSTMPLTVSWSSTGLLSCGCYWINIYLVSTSSCVASKLLKEVVPVSQGFTTIMPSALGVNPVTGGYIGCSDGGYRIRIANTCCGNYESDTSDGTFWIGAQ
jgi:hypothetical protein